jgi:hypothetical protein
VRSYLAIPGASVAVERLFSGGRDTLGIRRWSLGSEAFRALTLLGEHYKCHPLGWKKNAIQMKENEEILDLE